MARTITKGLIVLLLLGSASLAQAQSAVPTDPTAATPAPTKTRVVYESLVGYGAVGFRGGTLKFLQDEDTAENATPRLSGDLNFTYVWDDNFVGDLVVGYGWNRLGDDEDYWLVTTVPMTVGVRYLMKKQSRNRPFVGGGLGAYIWSIQSKDLGVSKDAITYDRLRRGDLGFYGIGGLERRMSKSITASADVTYHYILANHPENFPAGFDGNKSYIQARIGINFYFSLSERLDQGLPE